MPEPVVAIAAWPNAQYCQLPSWDCCPHTRTRSARHCVGLRAPAGPARCSGRGSNRSGGASYRRGPVSTWNHWPGKRIVFEAAPVIEAVAPKGS
jgi:hypothetical protein